MGKENMIRKEIEGEMYTCFTEKECSQIFEKLDFFENKITEMEGD